MVPVEVMFAMLTRFPVLSILWVPATAPVLIPVVPLMVVPVIVFAVAIVPNPEAIEPEINAPVVVKDEEVTPAPRVEDESTSVLLIWYVFPDPKVIVPVEVTFPVPLRGERVMFPVDAPPIVKFWFAVV